MTLLSLLAPKVPPSSTTGDLALACQQVGDEVVEVGICQNGNLVESVLDEDRQTERSQVVAKEELVKGRRSFQNSRSTCER